MTKTMLIDATHAEETRVAVVDGKRLVEFDYESKVRKQLKGSIYLAKVTRVEPSLQAAFVNFGGNRHGFLPFSEIHPDYFRIPVADREALIAAQQEALAEHDEEQAENSDEERDEDDREEISDDGPDDDSEPVDSDDADSDDEESVDDSEIVDSNDEDGIDDPVAGDDDSELDDVDGNRADGEPTHEASSVADDIKGERKNSRNRGRRNSRGRSRGRRSAARNRQDEMVGGDGIDSDRPFRFNLRRNYKIQEVVKRGQIMLIQVSKEERGNKGAAVTTYLSLPGRYCVLMPNSPRGGGVSRKIAHYKDRKRMREILTELKVPEGMSVILRTAGVQRTKAEIKRDLDYLTRLWNTIREETLQSSAPSVIYEEGNLIKRSIRDLYDKDIDTVQVAGDEGYKGARNFMKMLIPSHVKKVQEYTDERVPLFHKYNVENQIAEIGVPSVTLKSGGSIVINPTEALVAIDVNSGRATKERHIEETALKTNLEAADEVARQLRLRDLGGLVVVDFIDMEDRRNNRRVEQRMKEALSSDRARIQVGRISSFGLLELSRQRLNPSLTEAQFETCPHCQGFGYVRTLDFAAIAAIRALEEEGIRGKAKELALSLPDAVAVYILNNKRQMLADIEARYGFRVYVEVDEALSSSAYRLDVLSKAAGAPVARRAAEDDRAAADADVDEAVGIVDAETDEGEKPAGQKRGRRRGRRGGRRRNASRTQDNAEDAAYTETEFPAIPVSAEGDRAEKEEKPQVSRQEKDSGPDVAVSDDISGDKSRKPRRRGAKVDDDVDARSDEVRGDSSEKVENEPSSRGRKPRASAKTAPSNDSGDSAPPPARDYEVVNQAPEKKKKGWWNKLVE